MEQKRRRKRKKGVSEYYAALTASRLFFYAMGDQQMEILRFKEMLKNNNGIPITDSYILFNTFELYDLKTNQSVYYGSFEEALNAVIDNKTLRDIVLAAKGFELRYDGGRGGESGALGGGFGHASDSGNGSGKAKLNVEFNGARGKTGSYNETLKTFISKYANADHEYGVAADELGYVYSHMEGGKSSVMISGNKGQTVIHNHPSGSNFSDTDLISTALTSSNGIVAVGGGKTYSLAKTSKFSSNSFVKAVKTAKWPTKYNYDQGADWWLKKNAKTYGYKYSSTSY